LTGMMIGKDIYRIARETIKRYEFWGKDNFYPWNLKTSK